MSCCSRSRPADIDILRANMLEAWNSLPDDERANFDANFPALNELLNNCFADWDANRNPFEDAGDADGLDAKRLKAAQESLVMLEHFSPDISEEEGR